MVLHTITTKMALSSCLACMYMIIKQVSGDSMMNSADSFDQIYIKMIKSLILGDCLFLYKAQMSKCQPLANHNTFMIIVHGIGKIWTRVEHRRTCSYITIARCQRFSYTLHDIRQVQLQCLYYICTLLIHFISYIGQIINDLVYIDTSESIALHALLLLPLYLLNPSHMPESNKLYVWVHVISIYILPIALIKLFNPRVNYLLSLRRCVLYILYSPSVMVVICR